MRREDRQNYFPLSIYSSKVTRNHQVFCGDLFVCLFQGLGSWYACRLTDVLVFAEFPHVRDPPTYFRHTLGGRTLIHYTLDLKQDCSTSLTLPQAF